MSETRETTVLFAGLMGAADLIAAAGDAAEQETMKKYLEVLTKAAEAGGGRAINVGHDRLMVLLGGPDAAADTAAAMHTALGEVPKVKHAKLSLGTGFHHGPVIQEKGEVFGDTVTLAARLAEQAGSGQIITSEETGKRLGPLYKAYTRRLGPIQIKGRAEEVGICELVWKADENATKFARRNPAEPLAKVELTLRYRDKKVVRRRDKETVVIGRGEDCGLVVADELASRQHCTIERRHDHFVLIDTSANGTFVTIEGEREVMLQREELMLRKHGWITFGQPGALAHEMVEFSLA